MEICGYQQIMKKYGFIVNKIKKFIMGLIEKNTKGNNTVIQNEELNKDEYEFLFNVLRNCDFKGHQVESLYNIVVKLQKKYVNLVNNQ
jgi:hypothetical protein